MSYDNDDERNAREQYQERAEEKRYAKPIGHVLYWQGKGRPIDGKSPIIILALLNKDDLDDYFLEMSHYLKLFTKRPKVRWPPNDRNGRFILVSDSNLRELEGEIIERYRHPREKIRRNTKAVVLALFNFKEDPGNLIIVMGMLPFSQSSELIMRINGRKPRLVYQAEWLSQDFIESFENWALGG